MGDFGVGFSEFVDCLRELAGGLKIAADWPREMGQIGLPRFRIFVADLALLRVALNLVLIFC